MKVYMMVTKDEYELPLAVADSAKELAEITGRSVNTIRSAICHFKRRGGFSIYRKVEVEDDE